MADFDKAWLQHLSEIEVNSLTGEELRNIKYAFHRGWVACHSLPKSAPYDPRYFDNDHTESGLNDTRPGGYQRGPISANRHEFADTKPQEANLALLSAIDKLNAIADNNSKEIIEIRDKINDIKNFPFKDFEPEVVSYTENSVFGSIDRITQMFEINNKRLQIILNHLNNII